ncbi:MAG: Na(+)-translocating NADH-quinone reductase subunit A [Bacteroidia bacterium]
MPKTIRLKKGHDIRLVGEAYKFIEQAPRPTTFAIKPPDFRGIVPKLLVKEGEEVKAGSPLFYDKYNERVQFTAPVSGEVAEIKRGAKRKILEIKILADSNNDFIDFGSGDPAHLSREEIKDKMLASGVWPFLRQRPFSKIAKSDEVPRDIFISGFNSAPLAPDYAYILKDYGPDFKTGLDAIKKLTDGKVYLSLPAGKENPAAFVNADGVEINYFSGPHPSGNVGVQIHHLAPLGKGEMVWYINPLDLITIGKLFNEGRFNGERIIAITGSEAPNRKYFRTTLGTAIAPFSAEEKEEKRIRHISGNVLTGTAVAANSYLGFYDYQLTIIPEGDEPEFMGWLFPSYPRPTLSRTFPWAFMEDKKYVVNTNMHGEERPFVITGKFEKVMPMDILPLQLLKACLTEDLDAMEGLGLYEVDEEDFALVEFMDTSKLPIQSIIRDGLDLMEKEG